MKIFLTSLLTLGGLLLLMKVEGQKKQASDVAVFSEFTSIGQMYKKLPLQLTIEIQNRAVPVTTATDTLQTTMELYIAQHFYYMQSEGIEEMITDSLLLMVNYKVKEMQLFRSSRELLARTGNMPALFMQDSSSISLTNKFDAEISTLTKGNKKIDLVSKAKLQGTDVPRESITVIYQPSNFQIVECVQRRTHLIPVDSSLYSRLQSDIELKSRLLRQTGSDGEMYFLIKENSTHYKFTKVDYNATKPPAIALDRIVKSETEKYMPAKGFENYLISQQF